MNQDVLKKKLESLFRCLQRIKTVCPQSIDILEQDITTQEVLILNIQRSVQLCVDIGSHILSDIVQTSPQSMSAVFILLAENKIITPDCAQQLIKSVGFRNIAVHEYDSIDMNIVFAVATKMMKDFESFAQQILVFLDTNNATNLSN